MSFKGAPDWTHPLRIGGGDLYVGFEEPMRVFAPPLELTVAQDGPNMPAFALEMFRLEGGADGLETFGLLTIRFVGAYALAERQAEVFAQLPAARVEPLIPRTGFLRFETAAALGLAAALTEPRPLVWAGAGALTLAARLDGASAQLLHEALQSGLTLADAVAEVEVPGVAARAPVQARFDPAVLARAITAIATDDVCSRESLTSLLAAPDGAAVVTYTGPALEHDRQGAVEALADRLLARFARLAPAKDPTGGPVYRFDLGAMAAGEMTWDLNEPMLAGRAFVVRSNPLESARQVLRDGGSLVHTGPMAPFETGLHTLTVHPNLPVRRAGVLALGVEVRVPPFLPDRPQTVTATATFGTGERLKSVPLRLAPQEPVSFEYQAVAFALENGAAARLTGPWRKHQGEHLTIPPEAFPLRFVRVSMTPALREAARLSITCRGTRGAATWSTQVGLDHSGDAAAVAVPLDLEGGEVAVIATALHGGGEARLGPLPLDDLWLDLSSFPTAGPRCLDVVCSFDDAAELVAIECAPEDRTEDPAAVGLVRLTPAQREREWQWLAPSPFRSGYRCRWFRPPHEPQSAWSEPRDPAVPLAVISSARLHAPCPGGATEDIP